MPNSDHEIVIIVDQDNQVIDRLPRATMRAGNLVHRAVYIFMINRNNELFVQKRSTLKDLYPGSWDLAAGGVVLVDESYEQAAHRELREELGIDGAPLTFHFLHYYADRFTKVWGAVFTCRHEGPFRFSDGEIDSGVFLSLPAINRIRTTEPVTPDSLELLGQVQKIL